MSIEHLYQFLKVKLPASFVFEISRLNLREWCSKTSNIRDTIHVLYWCSKNYLSKNHNVGRLIRNSISIVLCSQQLRCNINDRPPGVIPSVKIFILTLDKRRERL